MTLRSTVSALVGSALLSSCTAAPTALPLRSGSSQSSAGRDHANAASRKYIFVADTDANAIRLFTYGPKPKLVRTITKGLYGPGQIAFDRQRTMYVPNTYGTNGNTVAEYPAGSTHPSVKLGGGPPQPTGVAIDSKGDVFVGGESTNAYIAVYEGGKKLPTRYISKVPAAASLAIDSKDNLYAASGDGVYEVQNGSDTGKRLPLVGVQLDFGVAIGIDDDLFVGNCNPGGSSAVLVFHAGQTKAYETIDYHGQCPYYLGVDAKGNLYASYPNSGDIAVFAPGSEKPFIELSNGLSEPTWADGESWPAQ